MKKWCLVLLLILVLPVTLRAQVIIGAGGAGPGQSGLPAGTVVKNPDPGTIPNGSIIQGVSPLGGGKTEIDYTSGGKPGSVTITAFGGFMTLGGGPSTNLTPGDMDHITANEQTSLTANPPSTPPPPTPNTTTAATQPEELQYVTGMFITMRTHGPGDKPTDPWEAYANMFIAATTGEDIFAQSSAQKNREKTADAKRKVWAENLKLQAAMDAAVQASNNKAATTEAEPGLVPISGDLGGPVDEIL